MSDHPLHPSTFKAGPPDPESEARAKAYFREHVLPAVPLKIGHWESLPRGVEIEPHGWQPIETAPKDGSWILLYEPPQEGCADIPMIACWARHLNSWADDSFGLPSAPTHWMPLPAPPQ